MAPDDSRPTVSATNIDTNSAAGEAVAHAAPSGPHVAGFEVLGELGRGGMGVVYHARQLKLNRDVALKMVLGTDRVGPKDVIRFLAEAEAVAAVKHPNVVQVYDYGESDGRPFMALEYLSGGTLGQWIRSHGRMTVARATDVLGKLAAGVAAAHAQGIVHRDLKPGNVLFDAAGEPKITDFGLAKRDSSSDLTRSNAVMGTPAYMAPEQAKGDSKFAGPTADVWALGGILYECLTSEPPFRGDDAWSILHNVMTADPKPPRVLNPDIPTDLEQVCLKCLQKEPHERYPTAAAFAADLQNVRDGRPVSARPVGLVERARKWARRNPLPAGLAAAFAVVLLGLIASLGVQVRSSELRAETEAGLRRNEETARKEAERLATEKAALATSEQERRLEADRANALASAELARANQVTEFLTGLFQSSDPLDIFGDKIFPRNWQEEQKLTARDFLDRATQRFKSSLTNQPLVRARLLAALGASYSNMGLYDQARPLLTEALWIRAGRLPADHADVLQSEMDLGKFELDQGDSLGAEARFRRVLATREKAGLTPVERARYEFHIAYAMGVSFKPEAIPAFRRVIAVREEHLGPDHPHTIIAKLGLVACLTDVNRNPLELLSLTTEITKSMARHPDNALRKLGEGMALFQKGVVKRDAPLPVLGELLGSDGKSTLGEAAELLRKALEVSETVLPKGHNFHMLYRWTYAGTLLSSGDRDGAAREYAATYAMVDSGIGYAHPRATLFLDEYAQVLNLTGKKDGIPAMFEQARAANRRRFGADNPWLPLLLAAQAKCYFLIGRDAAAVELTRELHRRLATGPVGWAPQLLNNVLSLVATIIARNDLPLAEGLIAAVKPEVDRRAADEPERATLCEFFQLEVRGRKLGYASVAHDVEQFCADPRINRFRNQPSPLLAVRVYRFAAAVARARADWERMEDHARKGVAAAHVAKSPTDEVLLYEDLAHSFLERGLTAEAVRTLEKARTIAEQPQWPTSIRGHYAELQATALLSTNDTARYHILLKQLIDRRVATQDAGYDSTITWIAALHPTGEHELAKSPVVRVASGSRAEWLLGIRRGTYHFGLYWRLQLLRTDFPTDVLLVAFDLAKRGYSGSAGMYLKRAEELIARETPSPNRPYAPVTLYWPFRFQAQVLAAELRTMLGLPEIAPVPRSRS